MKASSEHRNLHRAVYRNFAKGGGGGGGGKFRREAKAIRIESNR